MDEDQHTLDQIKFPLQYKTENQGKCFKDFFLNDLHKQNHNYSLLVFF